MKNIRYEDLTIKNTKYEILKDDWIVVEDKTLYRIRALREFGGVSAGELGGYIEFESNLSKFGNCWIYDGAQVFGDAKVYGKAVVFGNARVYGYARVYGNAMVYDNARVYGYAHIYENASINGEAHVYGYARIGEKASVYGNARVFDDAIVYGNARIYAYAYVYGNAVVYDDALVFGRAQVYGNAIVFDKVFVCDGAVVGDGSYSHRMYINAKFEKIKFFAFNNAKNVTALLVNGEWLFNIGCQKLITKETFLYRIHKVNGGLENNPHRQEYIDMLKMFN